MCLVDHALAESEVCVRQVGERLEQNLRGHRSLEVSWVELVPAGSKGNLSSHDGKPERRTDPNAAAAYSFSTARLASRS